jgi:CDP-diacylglycerol--glycerol-3-phosphate 3-phosphatidyltransferase
MPNIRMKMAFSILSTLQRTPLDLVNKIVVSFEFSGGLLLLMLKSVVQDAQLPVVEIASENIQIIQTPLQFYEKLKEGIQRSKRKIFLASLYLGTNEKELVEQCN